MTVGVDMKVFGREVAVWLGMLSGVFQALSAFGFDVSVQWQAIITAVITTLFGLLTAVLVGDGVIAAALGVAQALAALCAGLGLHMSTEHQALLLGSLAVVTSAFVRTQSLAPVPASAVSGPAAFDARTS